MQWLQLTVPRKHSGRKQKMLNFLEGKHTRSLVVVRDLMEKGKIEIPIEAH